MTDTPEETPEPIAAVDAVADAVADAAAKIGAGTEGDEAKTATRLMPTSQPVLARALIYGAILAAAIAVVGAILGYIFAGMPAVYSALVGSAMALFFLGLTSASILIANRFIGSDLYVGIFFAIVLGSWLVKFALFIVLSLVLKNQEWVHPLTLLLAIIAGVIGSLIVDVIVIVRARVPYVDAAS